MSAPLQTERLLLRTYREDDFTAFAALNANTSARQHVGGPLNSHQARQRFSVFLNPPDDSQHAWAITLSQTGEYIGHCWLVSAAQDGGTAEFGIILRPERWRNGFGAEATRAVSQHAVTICGYERVIATVDTDHAASIRMLEQSGFALLRRERDDEGEFLFYECRAFSRRRNGESATSMELFPSPV